MLEKASPEEISSDEEDGDLRDKWRTFAASDCLLPRHGSALTLLCPYRVLGTGNDEQALWYLSLTTRNSDLHSATSHLFMELNARYHRCVVDGDASLAALRDRHAQQLTALVEAANDTKDMIVGSEVTQRFVLRHQRELEKLQGQVRDRSDRLAVELREEFFAFLKTSASGVVAAHTRDSVQPPSSPLLPESPLNAVHISSFAQQLREWRRGRWRRRPPLVRTVELPNPLRLEIARLRPSEAAARPVVIDVSPTSALRTCLTCLYPSDVASEGDGGSEEHEEEEGAEEEDEGAVEEEEEEEERETGLDDDEDMVACAVKSHLRRLAQRTHAVLFLIGTRSEAEAMLAVPAMELLLHETDPSKLSAQSKNTTHDLDDRRQVFTPLPHHGHLLLMRSTRHWGANAILLWTPPRDAIEKPASAPFAEDALRLAYTWGADMFAVAVLNSAQALSMEVLRQLQRGIARLAYETDGATAASQAPMAAGKLPADVPPIVFNSLAVRVFLPLRIAARRGSGAMETQRSRRGVGYPSWRFRRASFSWENGMRCMNGEGSGAQHMSLDKLLVYTFDDSVVVH